MKRIIANFLLLASLTACTGAASPDRHNCSPGGEICIEVRADEPIFFGGQVSIEIIVTSEKDIPDLGVSLYHDADVVLDRPQNWEEGSREANIWESGASWKSTIEANQPIAIMRTLYLPPREGVFWIKAEASTQDLRTADTIRIYMKPEGGKIYLSGTKFPITPGPELVDTMSPSLRATLEAKPTDTPWPTSPVIDTSTPTPFNKVETHTPRDQGTSYPPPYP